MSRKLRQTQVELQEFYGAETGLDVRDFVRLLNKLDGHGKLLIDQNSSDHNVDLALLLDRDIAAAFEAGQSKSQELAVAFEEVSHFVYFSFNHNRGRNVTMLELEAQSEVDRIVLAFHSELRVPPDSQNEILKTLLAQTYSQASYEESRKLASRFVRQLAGGDPRAWTEAEFEKLRKFFHSDLAEKVHLAK
jgi:hypothetical protein